MKPCTSMLFPNHGLNVQRVNSSSLHLLLVTLLEVRKVHVLYEHTIYTRNNMGKKCEGNCGLWVPNEILKKSYPENLKKIVGAV